MPRSPKFSIVVPTYNRLGFLKQAIASVWRQTCDDYELIVVDDGSTDGTTDYLASLQGRLKRARQSNRGPAAARNFGVGVATGEYVAFLDSDDVWFPWSLASILEAIERYDQPSMIGAATLEFEAEVPAVTQDDVAAECFPDYFGTADKPGYVGSGALIIKRDIFNRVGGFDVRMSVGEDLDFYFRAGTIGSFVRILAPVTLGYRRHAGNMSSPPLALQRAAVELLRRDADNCYPGGNVRQKDRWKLLSRAVRPVALACLAAGLTNEAWRLYRQSFWMNTQLGRFQFLLGFPIYGVHGLPRGRRARAQPPERRISSGLHGR